VRTAHKLQDEWLLSYAAGALNPGRSLMVASHLAYHDDLQNTVADAEAIGGALLTSMEKAEVNDSVFDQIMSRIDKNPVQARITGQCEQQFAGRQIGGDHGEGL